MSINSKTLDAVKKRLSAIEAKLNIPPPMPALIAPPSAFKRAKAIRYSSSQAIPFHYDSSQTISFHYGDLTIDVINTVPRTHSVLTSMISQLNVASDLFIENAHLSAITEPLEFKITSLKKQLSSKTKEAAHNSLVLRNRHRYMMKEKEKEIESYREKISNLESTIEKIINQNK